MVETRIEELEAKAEFELEDYMNLCKESRLENETMKRLLDYWQNWEGKLKARKISSGNNSWLAVWLPEEVEMDVDGIYESSPSQGYLLNSLATYMCMSAVSGLLPQVNEVGCAPAPKRVKALGEGLEEIGVLPSGGDGERRYAIVTYYPFKGGCEICDSREVCPKANGGGDFASIVLPGYERGVND